ncbi:RluA family pseudouridine synthase [Kamptonema cortianum]|nr:RluA family pseudouridine synthase [Kamptonema cortianum]
MEFVAEGKERLDRFLARKLPDISRSRLTKHIESEGVRVDSEVVTKSGFQLKPGLLVDVDPVPESEPHDLTPFAMELEIPYEDEHLLIVNKPRGLTVHPASSEKNPTLVNALLARSHDLSTVGGDFRPGIVHRLDKETSGLMIVAKSDEVHRKLSQLIQPGP